MRYFNITNILRCSVCLKKLNYNKRKQYIFCNIHGIFLIIKSGILTTITKK